MNWHTLLRAAGIGSVAIILASTSGCRTASLESMESCKDPNVGFWAAKATGNEKLQKIYGGRLADIEFNARKKAEPGKTMPELRAYKQDLLRPVSVPASYPQDSADLQGLPAAEKTRLDSYIASCKEPAAVNGAECSETWAAELQKINSLMSQLDGIVNGILGKAQEKLSAGNVPGAVEELKRALELDRDGPAVVAAEKNIRSVQARQNLPELISSTGVMLKQVRDMQAEFFGTAKSSKAQLQTCMELIGKADAAVAAFRANLRAASGEVIVVPEIEKDLSDLEGSIASLTGRGWKEQLRLMASAKQYWQAYEYAEERSKELAKTPEKARAPMQKELGDGYVAILPAAAAYYVGEANKNFDQDAYGICFVLCRMSEEMIQYARDCLMPLSTETTDWEKRASDSRRDAETRLSSTMLRTVVVGEFTPTTPENQALAAKVNELSTLLLSGGKDVARAAWGVIVEKASTATKPKPSDYLVQAEVSVFLVADVPPQEMERSILKVHRDIREIPNPDYDKDRNPKAPKTVFSQEVFMYQSLRMQYAKRALLKMAVSCQQQGETANLLSLDTEFTNEDGRLESVNMSSIEQSLDVPFVGPPRISETSSGLTVDPWPKAVPPRLSSEAEIRNAMMKFAAQSIVDKIVTLVDRYPVDALAAEALKQQKLGNKLEAANLWGQCLKYCCSMTSSAAEPAQEPPSWTSQKDATLRRMSELSATRWKDSDSSLLAKVADIWSVAVRSTLEATETEH